MYFDIGITEIQQSAVNWIATFRPITALVVGLAVGVMAIAAIVWVISRGIRSG